MDEKVVKCKKYPEKLEKSLAKMQKKRYHNNNKNKCKRISRS